VYGRRSAWATLSAIVGQDGLLRQRGLQPATQLSKRGVRLVALAVQQAIDASLQPLAEWLKKHRHRTGATSETARLSWVRNSAPR